MKIAFFDRDGTIIEDYSDEDWRSVKHPILLPYAVQVLDFMEKSGYKIIIVTNQYLIGEGYITYSQYSCINRQLLYMLNKNDISILDVFFCPHSRISNCNCMKPKPGLINQAMNKYPTIELEKSIVVGDSISDIKLAEFFNLQSYGINVDYSYNKHTKVKDLKELYDILNFKN